MATGLLLPIQVTPRGGATTHEGSSLRQQNIVVGITPASCRHPWNQSLTPPENIIFSVMDETAKDLMSGHVQRFFEEQKKLGLTTLARNGVRITSMKNGQMDISIVYVDLEDNVSRTVSIKTGRK